MFHHVMLIALISGATLTVAPETLAQGSLPAEPRPDTPQGLGLDPSPERSPIDYRAAPLAQLPADTGETAPVATPSPAISAVQQRLTELGHYTGPVDGLYGDETRAAISDFQQSMGLARTGILDPLTQSRLDGSPPPSLTTPSAAPSAPTEPAEPPEAPPAATTLFPEAGVDGPPDSDLTPSVTTEGAAPETEVPEAGAEATPEDAPSETTSPRLPITLALLGLGVALLGTIGGGMLLLLSRRSESTNLETQTPNDEALPGEAFPGPMPFEYRSSPPQAATSTTAPQNGGPPTAAISPMVAPLAAEPTPRMSRINIVDELIQDLSNPDPTTRRKAIWELGQRGNSLAVQPLVNVMMDADSKERSLILAALGEISSRTLKPLNRALAISLQDENPEVRKNAIRDLTRVYDLMGQVSHLLGQAASDEDADVRQTAAWAMEQFNRMRLKTVGTDSPSLPSSTPRDTLSPDPSTPYRDG
ncbi:peptidoglycan-binding protein [Leptolyngbya sp. PCC 6406]|uniref:peptidoglycan-binding protein n=1 Tax=Leptolyngbya sp. PCC 6406 TaxID=1173264 RepID=UPI0002ABDEAC|nr:HEAT repeat domain-containing protein [Leptolyngbya sp. PCC 6406]